MWLFRTQQAFLRRELPLLPAVSDPSSLPLRGLWVLFTLPAENGAGTGWKGQDGEPVDLLLAVCGFLLQLQNKACHLQPTYPSPQLACKTWGPCIQDYSVRCPPPTPVGSGRSLGSKVPVEQARELDLDLQLPHKKKKKPGIMVHTLVTPRVGRQR